MRLRVLLGYLACLSLTAASVLPTEFSDEPAATPTPVTLSTVIDDINGIDTAVKQLISDLKPFRGGILELPKLINIATDFINVHKANRKALTNARNIETQFSKKDSQTLVDLVDETLVITNPRATELLIRKKRALDSLRAGIFAKLALKLLLEDHLSLSSALVRWVERRFREDADEAVETITLAIEDAIDVFS
ncbi:hypothetical protein ACHAQA_000078 [Verticillium albo-atrum]